MAGTHNRNTQSRGVMVLTPTQAPADAAQAEAAARKDIYSAFYDAGLYYEAHPGARLPASPLVQVRPAGANYAEKVADLRAIAASWDAPVLTMRDGTLHTEMVFGPFTIAASVAPPAPGVFAYKARMAQAATAEAA